MFQKNASPAWRIEIVVPASAVAGFLDAFDTFAEAVSCFMVGTEEDGDWRIVGYSRTPPDHGEVTAALALAGTVEGVPAPDPAFEELAHRDWVTENLRAFPPIGAGRYFVHGSHHTGGIPDGRIGLMVDAGTAFGTGEHETTRGCLLALDDLARRRAFRAPLDMGCGSGILAMAMAKTWRVPVVAADIDPISVAVAAENARLNGVADRIVPVWSNGFQGLRTRADARRHGGPRRFDVITANILARPLTRMAHDLADHLLPGGVVILSGLLARQERMVLAAYRMQGLHLIRRFPINGWHTLVVGGR